MWHQTTVCCYHGKCCRWPLLSVRWKLIWVQKLSLSQELRSGCGQMSTCHVLYHQSDTGNCPVNLWQQFISKNVTTTRRCVLRQLYWTWYFRVARLTYTWTFTSNTSYTVATVASMASLHTRIECCTHGLPRQWQGFTDQWGDSWLQTGVTVFRLQTETTQVRVARCETASVCN